MTINYTKIKSKPAIFLRLFGVTPQQLEQIMKKLTPLWGKRVVSHYKRPGRNSKLSLEEAVVMLLLYYRSYTTQLHVGILFGIHESNVCRLIRRLEPLLARIIAIPKQKELTEENVTALLIDATEQPIERPKYNQQVFYSGKKKRHTLKTEIRTTPEGKIVHVSQSAPGSCHDFALYKKDPLRNKKIKVLADSGYQGLDKLHPRTEIPYKKPKGKLLSESKKIYNRVLSRVRVKVENTLGNIKVFKILSERYRNKRLRYNVKFRIIAGIVNLKNGFATC